MASCTLPVPQSSKEALCTLHHRAFAHAPSVASHLMELNSCLWQAAAIPHPFPAPQADPANAASHWVQPTQALEGEQRVGREEARVFLPLLPSLLQAVSLEMVIFPMWLQQQLQLLSLSVQPGGNSGSSSSPLFALATT